ncbi:MAG: rRNA adenine N-6-methyltransferase family protein [Patescibacteria group bacterium]
MEEEIGKLLTQYKIKPDPLKDQFFLVDQDILEKIVEIAEIQPNEQVVEIGAGLGLITRELAKYTNNVLAIEIDKRFKPILDKLPRYVKVVYGDAWKILGGPHRPKISFDKLISNLPYSLCEPMMHKFTHTPFKMIVFVIPKKFLFKILESPIFSAFYKIEKVFDIPKTAFYPVSDSNAVVIKITRLKESLSVGDIGRFIRQYLYEHEPALVKNALREAVIKIFAKLYQQKLTKNQARKIIREAKISPEFLDKRSMYSSEIYFEVAEKIEKKLKKREI